MQSQSIVCIEHSEKFSHKYLQTKKMVYGSFLFTKIFLLKDNTKSMLGKGQLISKASCQAVNSSKKTNERIRFYYYATSFRSFFGRN
jgi:hypothetical protein